MKPVQLFDDLDKPVVFGHRGYSAVAPENTMEAFELCREKKIPGIELDIHLCASGELVVTHDFNAKRVSGVDKRIDSMTYGSIRTLDVGSFKGERYKSAYVPLLEEVFSSYGDSFIYDIELKQETVKDTGLSIALWKVLNQYGLIERSMVSSFNPFAVRSFRKLSKGRIPTAVIYCVSDDVPKFLQHGKGRYIAGCHMLKPHYPQITEAQFARDHERRGFPLVTWTVDDEEEIRRLTSLGVEGIISNDPGKTMEVIAAC